MNVPDWFPIVVQSLGWCLLHLVWQAALVGVLYAIARAILPRGNPRYLAAMAAMVLLAVLPIVTGWHEFRMLTAPPVDPGNVVVAGSSAMASSSAAAAQPGWLAPLRIALPWLVLLWGCGVAFLALRVFRQWRGLRAVVRAAEALPAWQARARRLALGLGLRRAVRVLASVRIATPTLVGWVRPVVVVPLAMLARMPTEQVDLILAHEFAHLRRLDHLANLFQVVVETLLFYHPVVHWISRDARNERELCCDALALHATGGKRRDFVAALAGLEEFRTGHADLALAASGGVLVERAWFIAGATPERRRGHAGLITIVVALLGVTVALGVVWRQEAVQSRLDRVLAVNAATLRHGLGRLVANFPAPVLHDISAQRPDIAPITPAPLVQPSPKDAAARPGVVVATAGVPTLAVADVEAASMRVAPAIALRAAASVAPPPSHVAPRAIHTVSPAYPPQALLEGLQGEVDVQFTLTAGGIPRDLRVVGSSAVGLFDAAALQALSQWRFAPPAVAGKRYRQIFTFRLGAGAGVADDGCVPATGTHICRHALGPQPGLRYARPGH
ncbi:MAG TPA: TonB family protein [Rhodanobacteraceae bacterium]|nr:TonB family protein [Rhodanobacteraceae bacterium]